MRRRDDDAVLVIGLGRFGTAVAASLEKAGHEVLAVEKDATLVQEWSGQLTHVVKADATSEAAMRQVGAQDFALAVVAIGNDIESSLLSASVLEDLRVQDIWAKAITPAHGRILQRIGIRHVVYPERDAGERVAHLITGKLLDFLEFEDDYAMAKLRAPRELWDTSLQASDLPDRGVTVIGVKRSGADVALARPDTVVRRGDVLVVSGPAKVISDLVGEG